MLKKITVNNSTDAVPIRPEAQTWVSKRAVAVAAAVLATAIAWSGAVTPVSAVGASTPASSGPIPAVMLPTPTTTVKALFLGDSIMKGYWVDRHQAWPLVMRDASGWVARNRALNGSGFLARGENNLRFSDAINGTIGLSEDVIFLQGSSNDFGQNPTALRNATVATFQKLRAIFPHTQIVGLSAVWGASALPPEIGAINADVKVATQNIGGIYLDVGQPLSGNYAVMQSDDIHPLPAGQVLLERAVASAYSAQQAAAHR